METKNYYKGLAHYNLENSSKSNYSNSNRDYKQYNTFEPTDDGSKYYFFI